MTKVTSLLQALSLNCETSKQQSSCFDFQQTNGDNNMNTNKIKKIIIATLISVGTLGGLTSYAMAFGHESHDKQGISKEGNIRADFMVYRLSSKLDLSDIQKAHLDTLKSTIIDLVKTRKEQKPREKVRELLAEPVLDQQKALELLGDHQAKVLASAPSVIAAVATFTDSLTEEQRATLLELIQKFGRHPGRPFGRGFSGGFGNNQ